MWQSPPQRLKQHTAVGTELAVSLEGSTAGDDAESGRESFPVALQGAAALVTGVEQQVQAGDGADF